MQLPQKPAGLLLVAAQQIGRGGRVPDLEGGLIVEQQVRPVLTDVLGHPQRSPAAGVVAVLAPDADVVHAGHVALPPLPPRLNAAVVGRIQLQILRFVRFVQVFDKSNDVHRAVSLL